jgi:hypothetical protein
MEPHPDGDRDNEHERSVLGTLERSLRPSPLNAILVWVRLHLLDIWGVRLAITAGTIISLAALMTMWIEMSSHIVVAVASEVALTAAALLFAHGVRLWWFWRRGKVH